MPTRLGKLPPRIDPRGELLMAALDGRVAIITGAGRGIGREHALLFAGEGARVVVNDLGGTNDGTGQDVTPAEEVAAEIRAMGGEAIVNGDNVADWEGGQRLVNSAIEAFGDLDIVVNNAGILRDRVLVNMTEAEWDAVIAVHLKGHFVPTRWAAAYWREQHKAGIVKPRNLVHTSSTSGLFSNPGQSNYGAAKSGIATFNQIVAKELVRYNVKSNCIAPGARTRLTLATPGLDQMIAPPTDASVFDAWDPANISPLVAYLATADCEFTGETFLVQGGTVTRVQSWANGPSIEQNDRWTVVGLAHAIGALAAE
jgi:NAD(P)-dependent dehydrogenase (short-subunit alcohol dehydrogenase family)